MYKLLGYISEDESFDAGYYEQQKRRRYSISWLTENGFVDLEDPDYIKACKKQETILHINYQEKPEPARSKIIKWSIIWSRLTFAITFAIRRKIIYDKESRARTLYDRVNVMSNNADRSDGEDDEMPTKGPLQIPRDLENLGIGIGGDEASSMNASNKK